MGQHFTLGAGPAQIMGQHVLPRLYGRCRRLWGVHVHPLQPPHGYTLMLLLTGSLTLVQIIVNP